MSKKNRKRVRQLTTCNRMPLEERNRLAGNILDVIHDAPQLVDLRKYLRTIQFNISSDLLYNLSYYDMEGDRVIFNRCMGMDKLKNRILPMLFHLLIARTSRRGCESRTSGFYFRNKMVHLSRPTSPTEKICENLVRAYGAEKLCRMFGVKFPDEHTTYKQFYEKKLCDILQPIPDSIEETVDKLEDYSRKCVNLILDEAQLTEVHYPRLEMNWKRDNICHG